jgi:hypothetical protein
MNNLFGVNQDIDVGMDRVSLRAAYQEMALRKILRHGVSRKEMGMAELEYREVVRDVFSRLDRM